MDCFGEKRWECEGNLRNLKDIRAVPTDLLIRRNRVQSARRRRDGSRWNKITVALLDGTTDVTDSDAGIPAVHEATGQFIAQD